MEQIITRIHEFDCAHRVMDHGGKCRNLHGHRYKAEISFKSITNLGIGYSIDFADIKKILGTWIDDKWDHGTVVNPSDKVIIDACIATNSKLYTMSLQNGYCNPTAENMSKELLLVSSVLFEKHEEIKISSIRLYETPNCFVDTTWESISDMELEQFKATYVSE